MLGVREDEVGLLVPGPRPSSRWIHRAWWIPTRSSGNDRLSSEKSRTSAGLLRNLIDLGNILATGVPPSRLPGG